MALHSTIDQINEAIIELGKQKNQLLAGGEVLALGVELIRARRTWLEARIARRKAEKEIDNEGDDDERFVSSVETFNAAAEAERHAYSAYERAVRAFDAAVGCVD